MKKLDFTKERNLNMLVDFYELTMSNGFFENGFKDEIAYFDMFFRKIPDNGGYVITAGLEQFIEYIESLRFEEEDIKFLRNKNIFSEDFLQYLLNFKFTGDIYAMPEGTVAFPNEPIVTVKAPIIQAQLLETILLITINHQSLIATKASRIVRSAKGKPIIEMGGRRSQGYDGALYGARASYIGGITSTSNLLAGKMFDIPVEGTMAHSWIQFFDSEYEAFKTYAKTYPDNCSLLIDTYDVLNSGLPNAIKVHNEVLKPLGKSLKSIRLDSGDIAYLSKKCRKILNKAGLKDCKIIVSNSLDEHIITSLLEQDSKIDIFGVGENLITSKSNPVFGGVYKLVAVEKNGEIIPKIKISENIEKISTPGHKQVWRLYQKNGVKAIADVITLFDENIDGEKPYIIFDPENTWKRKTITKCFPIPLLWKIYEGGKLIYTDYYEGVYNLEDIKNTCKTHENSLWNEIKRLTNPQNYFVDLSKNLYDLKTNLINENKKGGI